MKFVYVVLLFTCLGSKDGAAMIIVSPACCVCGM